MGEILRFLRQNETSIYLVLGAVAVFAIFRLLRARKDWKAANFGLEREIVQRRVASALGILLIGILFGLTVFILVSFVSPGFTYEQKISTPTIDLISSPTPTVVLLETPTVDLASVFNPTPTVALAANGCKAGLLEWTYPKTGDKIKGTVTLQGTVNYTNLGFYKYEYSQVGSDIWNPIAAGDSKVIETDLGGPWNTTQLTPGDYRLRLVATDNNDNPFPVCEITITILLPDE